MINYQTALEAHRAYKGCRLHLASIGLIDPSVNKLEQDWRKKWIELSEEEIKKENIP